MSHSLTPTVIRRNGFTLIEVLVSTAIMVFIIITVVTIASDTFRVYDRTVSDLSTQSEARSVLDAMENDFSTAILRPDGKCWMEIRISGSGSSIPLVGNPHPIDQPIIMLFASPTDRPRWTSASSGRRQITGDVCAIAYRLGQRSPFDNPGDFFQRIYGVYRTVIDAENTFKEALPIIARSNSTLLQSPSDYWNGSRSVHDYAPKTGSSGLAQKQLLDDWSLDEQNFLGANVVSMNIILWCTSSLPAQAVSGSTLKDPVARQETTLRPVFAAGTDLNIYGSNPTIGGYGLAFKSASTPSAQVASAPIRYAPITRPTGLAATPSAAQVHPYDLFTNRLRVYSNRMYPDELLTPATAGSTTAPLSYLPYTIKGVEVSLTLLTPEGSKELRGLQEQANNPKIGEQDFRRIVFQHGRKYTRYIRVLANGG